MNRSSRKDSDAIVCRTELLETLQLLQAVQRGQLVVGDHQSVQALQSEQISDALDLVVVQDECLQLLQVRESRDHFDLVV